MRFIARVCSIALALVLTTYVVPGVTITGAYTALIAGCVLVILNALVRPILIFFTLPITVLTLGLFIFVINATLFMFVASFVDGFAVSGFWPAFFGSLVVSFISTIINKMLT